MTSLDEPTPGWDSGHVSDVRAEALDVISDALQWRLTNARWEAIAQVLAAMAAALAEGDVAALSAATADLELAGPLRLVKIDATSVVPAPPQIRERMNRLVHSLSGAPGADRDG
jgi:hypothetical protein